MNRATVGVLVLGAAIGMLLSLYGPAIPQLRADYGVGGSGSALVLSAHFAGAMTGIGWWGRERRLADRTWLAAATALLAAGAAGIAFAPTWPVVLLAAFGVGTGFGVAAIEINVLLAEAYGRRAAAMLNLLGAAFGAGAVAGPLAVGASGGYRLPFCAGGLLAVAGLALARDLPAPATAPAPARERPPAAMVGGFVALCGLYVGVESGVGGFEATSLLAVGSGAVAAANWTAGFWAALTAGRLLAIPLALRLAPPQLAAGSLLVATAGLALAHLPALAPAAYTLTGLALGPVFPTVLAWLASSAPGSRRSTAMVFAGAQVGGLVLPVVIGRLVDAGTPAVIPTTVLAVALACLATTLLLSPAAGRGPSPGRR